MNINLPHASPFHRLLAHVSPSQIKPTGRFRSKLIANDDTLECSEILPGLSNFIHFLERL